MDHPGLKTGLNEKKFTAEVFIQHHGAVQSLTAIPRLTRAPLRLHTARTDLHWAWKKQPAKADYLSPADFGCEI